MALSKPVLDGEQPGVMLATMPPSPEIRPITSDEYDAVRALTISAFGDQSLGRLLDLLRESWAWHDDLAFVAVDEDTVVGFVLLTASFVDADAGLADVLVLSPLAVDPDRSGGGLGTALVRHAIHAAGARPERFLFVEGDPSYYGRFGFEPAVPLGFGRPSERIPEPAFQVMDVGSSEPQAEPVTGRLVYPDAFWQTDSVGLRPDVDVAADTPESATSVAPEGDGIRLAWRGDFTSTQANELHAEAFDTRVFTDDEWDWRRLAVGHSLGWVTAHRGDRLVGFVNVLGDGFVHAWLQDLMVATDERGSGLGRRLVAKVIDQVRDAGCEWLHVDFDDELRSFYVDACGFEPTMAGLVDLTAD